MKKVAKLIGISIILVAVILLARFAYAKYMSKVNGSASADIAHFSFNVTEESSSSLTIDLADTRFPEDTKSVHGKTVAPGTSGGMVFNVNANTSDVSLVYNIELDISAVPKNLIFYYDSDMKNAIYHSQNKISINGFFSKDIVNKTQTKTIYWSWPLETGQTQAEVDENDEDDSSHMGEEIIIAIKTIGMQAKENPFENQYELTFNANGGTMVGYGNSEKVTKVVNYGENYEGVVEPRKVGYDFDGWENKNLFDGVTFTEQFIDANGNFHNADLNNLLSDFIPVEEGCEYIFKLRHNETSGESCDWMAYMWYSDKDINSNIGSRHMETYPVSY